MTKRLYKDGSLIKFKNYKKAIPVAFLISLIAYLASESFTGAFIKPESILGHLFENYPEAYSAPPLIIALVAFILMLYILQRPLFILKDQTLTYTSGLFSRNSYNLQDLTSIQISSDKKSVTLDFRTIGGLSNTIEMYSAGKLGKHIKDFLEVNTQVKVIYLD